MRRLLSAALLVSIAAGCGKPGATPAPAVPESPPDGAALYARHCAGCHGDTGAGDGRAAVSFSPIPRDFTTGKFAYRSTGPQGLPSDADLYRTVADGLRWSAMPPFDRELSPPEIRAVVAQVKQLSRAQDEDGEWHNHFLDHPGREPLQHEPPPPFSQTLLERGGELFLGSFCVNCHGPEGAGDGTSAEWLVDSEGVAITPRDLRNPIYQRGAAPRDIFLRIRCGIPGTPMPSLSRNAPDADAWAIAFYVRSLQRTPADFVERGKLLYHAHGCAECHSEDLVGIPNPGAKGEWTTPMMTLAERIGLTNAADTGNAIEALRTGAALPAAIRPGIAAARTAIREGKDAVAADPAARPAIARMPGWGARLTDRDIDAILAYCLSLQLWLDDDDDGGGAPPPNDEDR